MIFPSTACILQNKLGVHGCAAFDVQAVCSGFVYALTIADSLIRTGAASKALVVGSEVFSRILDFKDRTTCVLFGDGAGAVVLEASDRPGILASELRADGRHANILCTPGTVAAGKVLGHPMLRMDGPAVFKLAVGVLEDAARSVLAKADRTEADIDWLIPHQANHSHHAKYRAQAQARAGAASWSRSMNTATRPQRRSRSRSTSRCAAARSSPATPCCSRAWGVDSPGVRCCSISDSDPNSFTDRLSQETASMTDFAFVFPGQGSQAVGMLDAWGDNAAVSQTLAEASDALDEDVARLIREGPKEQLDLTSNTQPVMLAAGIACYRAWLAQTGRQPALVAGHSLGEYTALVAAGALTLKDALPLVRFRAQAMQDAVPVGVGAMAAILGLEADEVRQGCTEAAEATGEAVAAANFNDPETDRDRPAPAPASTRPANCSRPRAPSARCRWRCRRRSIRA